MLFRFLPIIIISLALYSFAGEFSIISLTASSADISFSVNNISKAPTKTETTLFFAVSSQPSVTITGRITGTFGISCKGNCIKKLSSGWRGKEFLQWFSITFQRDEKNRKNLKEIGGIITITYDPPIVKPDIRLNNVSTKNCVIKIPVRKIFQKRTAVTKPSIPYTTGVRMGVYLDGIYMISGRKLKKLGIPIGTIPLRSYRLFCKDAEIPLYIANSYKKYLSENDIILFYGQFLRGDNSYYTQYSNINVYWLTWGSTSAGARVSEASGELKIDPNAYNPNISLEAKTFIDTIHLEEDNDIRWLGDIWSVEETEDAPLVEVEEDNWYWGFIGKNKITDFTFSLPSPLQNTKFHLKIAVSGLTNINENPNDHQFSVLINDKETNVNLTWDDQSDTVFTINNISSSLLSHGENTISYYRLQHDSIPDLAALNWFEIAYTKGFKAYNNQSRFKVNPKDINRWIQFNITDFTTNNLELWDITRHRIFSHFEIVDEAKKYTLSFQDSITSTTSYYIQSTDKRLSPLFMELDTIKDDWDFPAGVDYIIISSVHLLPEMEPLVEYHRQTGLQVATIDLQDIYNRFSYGIRNPESFRTMLKYVFSRHIDSPPQYLLLGGDCIHDLDKKISVLYHNVVPTHLSRVPNWGPASNDDYFATVQGEDNFPDLYVGRFPVRTTDEMRLLVNKTVNYLRYPEYGYWKDNMILIGGVEQDFTLFNNDVVKTIIGPKMNVLRVDANPDSPYYMTKIAASKSIAGYINAGAYSMIYTGHGGGNIWESSFSHNDLPKLYNSQWGEGGRLPIIFSFTCLTGFFESLFYTSLGEEFLRQSADGCIAFYSASAYTKKNLDIKMSRTLIENSLNGSFESLGELLSTTEILMLVNNESEAIPLTRQYNLLGDPAIPWKLTPDTLAISLENTNLTVSDTLKISGNSSPIVSGNVKLSVKADNNIQWAEAIQPVTNGSFNHSFVLKQTSQTANGLVRAFVWSDSAETKGWVHFSKDTFVLHDVAIIPTIPALGESVSVSCKINSRDSLYLPIIQCRYTIADPQDPNISFDDTSYVFMEKNTATGVWESAKKFIIGKNTDQFDMNKSLVLKFFATGNLGASDFFFFKITGRPDLMFTSDSIWIHWQKDSLHADCEVLNVGNTFAPPFSVTFLGYGANATDTLFHGLSADSLPPGKTTIFSFSIPDTQDILTSSGTINMNRQIEEVSYSNNSTTLFIKLSYADLRIPADTLLSIRKGCRLVPSDTLSKAYRVFLLNEPLRKRQPLLSESEWVPLNDNQLSKYYIHSRPFLDITDSLRWLFYPEDTDIFNSVNSDSGLLPAVFAFDTAASQWRYRGGIPDTLSKTVQYVSNEYLPLALGRLMDRTPPEIRVFVAGKEIVFVDYAAKNKPFNIFITDSSGIQASSIELLHNSFPLESEYKSSLTTGDNPSTVSLTAYPQKMNAVDSLTVIAEDNAGNRAVKVFTYRPGENLKIKFFSCHPNPFSAKPGKMIRFPFLLTDIATKVTLTIYTISGRKVWRWKNSTELIGYQEIAWDGTTQNRRNMNVGYRIANGTYYAKLVAQNRHKTVEKIIRIAKLEGY